MSQEEFYGDEYLDISSIQTQISELTIKIENIESGDSSTATELEQIRNRLDNLRKGLSEVSTLILSKADKIVVDGLSASLTSLKNTVDSKASKDSLTNQINNLATIYATLDYVNSKFTQLENESDDDLEDIKNSLQKLKHDVERLFNSVNNTLPSYIQDQLCSKANKSFVTSLNNRVNVLELDYKTFASEDQLLSLISRIDTLTTTVATKSSISDLNTVKASIETIVLDIDDFVSKSYIAPFITDVNTLKESIITKAKQTDLEDVKYDVEAVKYTNSTTVSKVAALENKVSTNLDSISDINSRLGELTTTVENLDGLSDVDTSVFASKESVSTLSDTLTTSISNINTVIEDEIKVSIASNELEILKINTELNTKATLEDLNRKAERDSVNNLKTLVDDIYVKLETIESSITSLSEEVESLKSKLDV